MTDIGGSPLGTRFLFQGELASRYDRINRWATLGMDGVWREALVKRADPFLRKNPGPLLDLACGTGEMTRILRDRHRGRTLLGLDLSREMMEQALKKPGPWNLVQGGLPLPFRCGSLTAVFCAFGIRNFADLPGEIHELFRVLRPGGRLYVLEFFRRDSLPVRFLRRVAGTLLFPLLARATGSDPGAYRYLISSMGSFLSLPQVEEVMERGGFRTIGRKSLFFGLLALWEGER